MSTVQVEQLALCRTCKHARDITGESVRCGHPTEREFRIRTTCQFYDGKNETTSLFPVDIAIIVATEVEFGILEKFLPSEGHWERKKIPDDGHWHRTVLKQQSPKIDDPPKLRIVATRAHKMGLPSAAARTTEAIHLFRPRFVVMLGICAGREEKGIKVGDIIVPTQTWDYGSGKWIDGKFHPAPSPIPTGFEIIENIRHLRSQPGLLDQIRTSWVGDLVRKTVLEVHDGPFASGAAVVSDPKVWKHVAQQNKDVLGLDMEAYGVAYAAYYAAVPKRPEVLIIKSVSDLGKMKTPETDNAHRYATFTSIEFFKAYANMFLFPPTDGSATIAK